MGLKKASILSAFATGLPPFPALRFVSSALAGITGQS
jgi:hypothetical protein